MKICQNCNFECNDQDRFCGKCGMPFPEVKAETEEVAPIVEEPKAEEEATPEVPVYQKPEEEPQPAEQSRTYQVPPRYMPPQKTNEEEPISVGKWVLYHLIPFIPGVGSLIYIVMLFIWSFGSGEQNATFRNWAKSQLIVTAISFVLVLFIVILVVVLAVTGAVAMDNSMDYYYEYGY
ncbi:MAG: hypothetical protein IJ407_05720 [Clostridia bacterium]|nr:hypothetical protein [Clostridia bacterium]